MSRTSKRMRLLIDNLGINQKAFAMITGITEASVCRYLDGTRVPNANTLISITEATKVSPSWLLGYGDDNEIERI